MKQMKNFKIGLAFAAVVTALMASLASCSNLDSDYEYYGPNALVTIKTTDAGNTYFQLDKNTTLEPKGWTNPYKLEVRALLRYTEDSEANSLFSKTVRVDWIDTIRTKAAVPYDEEFKKGADDGVQLINDWCTVCEDGYLTLHFATYASRDKKVVHYINLAIDPESHDLYLRYDRNGDVGYGVPVEGFVAFKLDDLLAGVEDGKDLTLHWTDYNGERTATVKYSARFALSQSER